MDNQVSVVRQHPLCLVVPFQAVRQFVCLLFDAQADFVADSLDLALVVASADDEVIGKTGDAGEVEDPDIGGFFGFGGPDCNQPGGKNGL